MAQVVTGQMLSGGVVKGSGVMALRFGREVRFARDLNVARIQTMADFRRDFEDSLREPL